jgi:YbbR domain-containing protein
VGGPMIRNTFVDGFWSFVTTNVGTKLISIVIAVVLWVVVLGSRNVEVTKDVPLEIITPAELVASNDIPDKVTFRLSGPKAFLRSILDRREEPIRVNLVGSKVGLVTYRFFSDNIRVPIGVKILGINPTSIVIKLEQVKRKEVPVRLEIQGVPPDGYKLSQVKISPENVKIKGAESKVDAIAELQTTPIDISDLRESSQKAASFDLSRYGVSIEGSLPVAKFEVTSVSANFRIKNIDIRVTSSLKSRVDDKNVSVLVRADAKELKNLDRSKVFGSVDLSGKPKGTYEERVNVTLPANVYLVKVIPEKVTVTLY